MSTPRKPEPDETRVRGPERILPITCIAGAVVLAISEFMTTFQLVQAGGDPVANLQAYDRHHYAMLVVALFAIGATIVAVVAGSKPAAVAVAVAGGVGLLLFLLVDLPDANKVGSFTDLSGGLPNAKSEPQAGFWLELIGSLALTLAGTALATLTPAQLHSLRPRWLIGSGTPPGDAAEPFDQHDGADELARRREERRAARRRS
jgi:hypothetical protein